MCGILFMFGPGSHEEVQNLLPRLVHRGPDDQRIIGTDEMALGFTRLAINGSGEVGAQPMEHEGMIGAFNGEVYNYRDLSEKYALPLSLSDTDVILPLFMKLNEGILDVLDGFFSGVIVDQSASKIWTIRDHIGKKPLFVGRSGTKVFITSELKAIDNVDHFSALPLGLSSVDAVSGEVKVIRQHQSFQTNNSLTNIFRDAVIKRLPAPNQPVAVFLSGGLDSSLVAAVVAEHRPDATYFTLGSGEPFHTLQMLYGESIGRQVPGGTCSDKTLSFIYEARERGFDAKLHTAFIRGKEIHRLARLNINGRVFFADVGNGWPSLHPYPADEPITHSCFGMTFRTEISDGMLSVYHRTEDEEKLQMKISLTSRPEEEILAEIEERFSQNITYPFENRMRFSAIVDDEFRFLRDNILFIYREESNVKRIYVNEGQWQNTLVEYFRWDVKLTENS